MHLPINGLRDARFRDDMPRRRSSSRSRSPHRSITPSPRHSSPRYNNRRQAQQGQGGAHHPQRHHQNGYWHSPVLHEVPEGSPKRPATASGYVRRRRHPGDTSQTQAGAGAGAGAGALGTVGLGPSSKSDKMQPSLLGQCSSKQAQQELGTVLARFVLLS